MFTVIKNDKTKKENMISHKGMHNQNKCNQQLIHTTMNSFRRSFPEQIQIKTGIHVHVND